MFSSRISLFPDCRGSAAARRFSPPSIANAFRARLRTSTRLKLATVGAVALGAFASPVAGADRTAGFKDDLFQMDLESLMDLRITHAATLTLTDARRVPVSMTQISERDLSLSGAIDLNRLLELLVPNTQFIDHHHLQPHLGFRGIISDREDKYLYQVNGRTMNNWTLLGADNERALPLLGDIKSISVVRGPASATHGPGAVAGVIDVQTHDGLSFQGGDVKVRHGFGQRYTAVEIRHGQKFSPTSGAFVYYGVADVKGADSKYYLGRSFAAKNGLPASVAGEPLDAPKATVGGASYDNLWHKLHVSYVSGPLELWARYVQDGGQDRPMREIYTLTRPAGVSLAEWTRGRQFRNRQTTLNARFEKDLAPNFTLELAQSYDRWSFLDQRAGVYALPIRDGDEEEVKSRAVGVWKPTGRQSLAVGVDYSHVNFHNPPYSDTLDRAPAITQRDWDADMFSLMAEHQWALSDRWTTFLSFRTDKHTFSDWLTSPRGTVVFTPSERDTIKLMAGQAVRRGGDEELWSQWVRRKTIPKPESLRSYEISYQHKASQRWRLGGAAFYQDYDAIGWIPALYYSSAIGRFGIMGAEVEASYSSAKTQVTFSSGWSKLAKVRLPANAPAAGQAVTAEPYGYGDDLAEWAPFITKLAIAHELADAWTLTGSVVHYSGFPGAQDYANYSATFADPPSAVPYTDPGYTEPFDANLYVNVGVEYRPSDRWSVRLDAHNLAELVDEKLSKRNYYFRLSEFSVQPASLSLSLRYRY